jgi:hypothetical protein
MLERTRGLFGRSVRSVNVNIYISGTPTDRLNAASSLGGNKLSNTTPVRPFGRLFQLETCPYLLGGWGSRKDVRTGQLLDGHKEKWKSDIEVVKATVQFLEKTGRLTYQPEAD